LPQQIYQDTCLQFAAQCAKIDLKACREDKRCTLTQEQMALIEVRQGLSLNVNETIVRGLAKDCGDGVANCRPKDMAYFKRDCPTRSGLFHCLVRRVLAHR